MSATDAAGLDLPLTDVRVVERADGPVAAIGRHLVELGAEVIRVEPRAGGADRITAPLAGGLGIGFVTANLGKRSVALDLADADDLAAFGRLLAGSDILIDGTMAAHPALPPEARPDIEAIRRRHPALVVLSVSPLGLTGPCAGWQATDGVLHALSGELSRSGIPGRAPLLPPGDMALDCALVQGVYVTLLAYLNRLETGHGDHLDLALLAATAQTLDPGFGIAGSATAGKSARQMPRGRADLSHYYPIIRCADGFVRFCVLSPRQWRGLFEWMGRPPEFADPALAELKVRFASTALIPAMERFFADETRAAIEAAGQQYGVPTAGVAGLADLLESPHFRARKALATVEIAPGISAAVPNGVMEIDGERAGIRGPAPALAADQALLDDLDADAAVRPPAASGRTVRPLAGLKVLDLGVIVVGAETGRLLADQGADVIKVENAEFPDGNRQMSSAGLISASFAAGHRNKRGLGINLRAPEGNRLFRRLAAETDVILSNFKPGTMEALGLAYADLAADNPGLIMVDSSAFGPSGPLSRRLGYGPLVRAAAGLTAQWRYPGEPESFSDAITIYPDHVAARVGAIGVLALLIRRRRTGRGGTVSIAQAEMMLSHMAPEIAALSLHGTPEPDGHDAPWGVFACAGDDEWCVVTVRDDADFRALCHAIGRPDLAADPALAGRAGRIAARSRLDAALEVWLGAHTSRDAMAQLQAASVPAGAMLRVAELPEFGFFQTSGFFRDFRQAHIAEPFPVETRPVRSERLPDPPAGSAPLMGEHTVEIASERLDLTGDEIDRLIAAGIFQVPLRPGRQPETGERR